jgi:hypothetical protein
LDHIPPRITDFSFTFSSGAMTVDNFSGSGPSGISQCPGDMPCGKKIPTNLGGVAAGVWARAVLAGIMASNSGSAKTPPVPFRKVRRGMLLLVMNI